MDGTSSDRATAKPNSILDVEVAVAVVSTVGALRPGLVPEVEHFASDDAAKAASAVAEQPQGGMTLSIRRQASR